MSKRNDQPEIDDFPELIIGLTGPIGVDLDLLARSIDAALRDVGYTSDTLKLTANIERYKITRSDLLADVSRWNGDDIFNTYMRKMAEANALRKQYNDAAFLARIAVNTIQQRRSDATGDEKKPKPRHAHIVRQFKRPEEVELLRKVFGRRMVHQSASVRSLYPGGTKRA
jgi:hypothetical protein